MTPFHLDAPILRPKQSHLDVQDLAGLLRIHWRIGDWTLLSSFYTRIDQVFVLWGWVTFGIFATAQFLPVSWHLQAAVWTGLTLAATAGMAYLAWYWVRVEKLRWVVAWWATLMVVGLAMTDISIYCSWVWGLVHLCHLWLGLCALGYGVMGWGMRSRAFLLSAAIHLAGMAVLPGLPSWQFLTTGTVMAGCLLFLAEVQWDMRPPIASQLLTVEQQAFNHRQAQLRQGT